MFWFEASRPKTLVASFVPVLVGSKGFLFTKCKNLDVIIVLIGCFLFSGLVQIATNLANDYFDSVKGADRIRTIAPKRMVSSGEISGDIMFRAAIVLLILAFGVGLSTVLIAGADYWFIALGLLCIFCAIWYTAGPFALAYNGLGDVFVIVFFGFVGVEGTNYLLSCTSGDSWVANLGLALSVGLLINNLLVVNNYRDREEDLKVSKRTSIVIFGKKIGIFLFLTGYLVPCFVAFSNHQYSSLVIIVTSTFSLNYLIRGKTAKEFSLALSLSAMSVILYGFTTVFY
ncbi:1,4-dihydroxy-2-naphthoate octaprenyltransferase [Opitutales bacterium]|nr:1,4-dihydroxy-2-naphthoate octaprenyltransferase [Opitutales bacterium]